MGERVHFLRSVPVSQVRPYTRQASVGVSLLEDTCENHRLALPNKLFEYYEADVPVVASDLPEVRAVVESLGAGETVDPSVPGEVAERIGAILAAREDRRPSRNDVYERPSWTVDGARLTELYDGLAQ
jgi:glycosyltransferase involved in cell wall biosynthesis